MGALALSACAPSVPLPVAVAVPSGVASAEVEGMSVAPAEIPPAPRPSPRLPALKLERPEAVEPVVPEVLRHPLRVETKKVNGMVLTLVSYDRRDYGLRVVDQASPGARWDTARVAAGMGIAAINGGFFTPEGRPLGMLVAGGSKKGVVNRASFLGSGFFIGGMDRLMSRDAFLAKSPSAREVLQSGPRLLWNGVIPKGLSNGERRPRSLLLWDGNHHFAIAHADSASLAVLARVLKSQPLPNFQIKSALNLDGGRSSDLWVSGSVKGGPLTRRSWMNKPVRNYLVLHRK